MSVNLKKIAKNSIYLYVRMVVTMLITIYSSRILLQNLGVEGFGTYNIIYGIVYLFLFIQSSLNTSTIRFISNSIAISNEKEQIKVFNTSFQATILLSIAVLVLLETVGLYFVNNVLKIGPEYKQISGLCYQICIISYIFQIVRIPFTSLIVSNEKMSFFAVISILESVLKLLAVILLSLSSSNTLIKYCIYIAISTLLCSLISWLYCYIRFRTCRITLRNIDFRYFKSILNFSGWTTLSSFANSLSQQGGNILMNVYNGVVANAAWGIAHQVNVAFASLASSLQTAFNPQINKSYAEKDYQGLTNLVYRASSIAYYLVLFIGLPIIFNMEFVLDFWLTDPPQYAKEFCIAIVVFQMIDTMQGPFNTLIFASGNVRFYNIWLSSILIFNIIISAILLSLGISPVCVPATMVILNGITGILRFIHVKHYLKINLHDYFKKYLIRMMVVAVCGSILLGILSYIGDVWMLNNFLEVILSVIITCLVIFFIGFSRKDKILVVNKLIRRIR